ncbi:MAG: hypothetical protein A2Z20_03005 [Bdellovibrionales bacterium RBG_16_40_8]|nr:MAG: hypothetical protein A2Z20_03005 [Bdellovibrionales bacterium RBG_16_40_8]
MFVFIFLILFSSRIENALPSRLYVWRVGQGQWITWVKEQNCLHFDMGGESAPTRFIQKLCRDKKNSLFLSHADLDHIRFIPWGKKNLANLCLHELPRETLNEKKRRLITSLPLCTFNSELVEDISITYFKKKNANDLSRVFLLKSSNRYTLIPGDSTTSAEHYWSHKISNLNITLLILGHHGSRYSTGDNLLAKLSYLRQTICSARKKRYGHPHADTAQRLIRRGLPLIATELWGNLSYEM